MYCKVQQESASCIKLDLALVHSSHAPDPKRLSSGHQCGHFAPHTKAWDQQMAGSGGKILVKRREGSFWQYQGMDEEGVFRRIWVSKQCHCPQAILISHLLFWGLFVEIFWGVFIHICLSLSAPENQPASQMLSGNSN